MKRRDFVKLTAALPILGLSSLQSAEKIGRELETVFGKKVDLYDHARSRAKWVLSHADPGQRQHIWYNFGLYPAPKCAYPHMCFEFKLLSGNRGKVDSARFGILTGGAVFADEQIIRRALEDEAREVGIRLGITQSSIGSDANREFKRTEYLVTKR